MTLLAEAIGVSQMHVSRLLTHALTYLRDRILGGFPADETAQG